MRKNISSDAYWEGVAGYSRAVSIANIIEISGTVAADSGKVVGKNNEYEQTKFILQKFEDILKQAGASLSDIVRTRIYVKDISKWEEIAKAHNEIFGSIKPATSMVEVSNLISPEYLVEIEATAIVEKQ
jgi:enamine deaminase RidA (YjgF/YER057c/UK114 family)